MHLHAWRLQVFLHFFWNPRISVFSCTHEFSFLVGCIKRGWLATQSSTPPPPTPPLDPPCRSSNRISFIILIPIITCKYFEISEENKTGLISEICPRLNSVKKFTKITVFGKSATKIAKITKFYKAINKK